MNPTIETISQRLSNRIRARIEEGVSELVRLDDEDAAEMMLVRHAETAGCHYPSDEFDRGARLSRAGVDQARRLAYRLQSLWVEQIYCAPEQQTEETATITRRSRLCAP